MNVSTLLPRIIYGMLFLLALLLLLAVVIGSGVVILVGH